MTIDVLYLAWNRLEFTAKTFRLLLANTDWSLVRHLYIYDDGSTDGTRQFLDEEIALVPVPASLVHLGWHSPPAIMNHYVENLHVTVDAFAKVDSDCCVPPGWLNALAETLEANPELELLGSEAGMTEPPDGEVGPYGVQACSHIGGIGLMRVSAFTSRRRLFERGRFGFTEWQHEMEPERAWISPDLPMPLLDRMPMEPWLSLSERYVDSGWQRPGGTYGPERDWAWEWLERPKPATTIEAR